MKNKYEIQGDITVIYLRKRSGEDLKTIIDTVDFEKINSFGYTWFSEWCKDTHTYYVRGNDVINGMQKTIKLHRFIMDCPTGLQIDHINHDTLDNRRSTNLRIVTHSENHQNRKGARYNNITRIKWVTWCKRSKKYKVLITKNKIRHHVGYFDDIENAKAAAQEASKKIHGEFKAG